MELRNLAANLIEKFYGLFQRHVVSDKWYLIKESTSPEELQGEYKNAVWAKYSDELWYGVDEGDLYKIELTQETKYE